MLGLSSILPFLIANPLRIIFVEDASPSSLEYINRSTIIPFVRGEAFGSLSLEFLFQSTILTNSKLYGSSYNFLLNLLGAVVLVDLEFFGIIES